MSAAMFSSASLFFFIPNFVGFVDRKRRQRSYKMAESKEETRTEASGTTTNAFSDKDDLSDLALVVEGKKLHVHKMHLALYSPVFRCMFNSQFLEKESEEMELPGKHYKDVVEFPLQLYPVHSLQPITDDNLLAVLSLAEEYQVDHILNKCRQFIQEKLPTSYSLTTEQLLLYLYSCHQSRFQEEEEQLKDVVVRRVPEEIATNPLYDQIGGTLMRDIMYMMTKRDRCNRYKEQENEQNYLRYEGRSISPFPDSSLELEVDHLRHKLWYGVTLADCLLALERRNSLVEKMSLGVDGSIVMLILTFVGWVFFGEIEEGI